MKTPKRRLTDTEKHTLVQRYSAATTTDERHAVLVAFGRPSLNSLNRWIKEGYGNGTPVSETEAPRASASARDDVFLALLRKAEADAIITGEQAWKLLDLYSRIAPVKEESNGEG